MQSVENEFMKSLKNISRHMKEYTKTVNKHIIENI